MKRLFVVFIFAFMISAGCTSGPGPGPHSRGPEVLSRPVSKTEFFRSVIADDSNSIVEQLKRGAEIDGSLGTESETVTPLMVAVLLGNRNAASLLIMNGASLSASFHGYTARDFAYLLRQEELLAPFRAQQSRGLGR